MTEDIVIRLREQMRIREPWDMRKEPLFGEAADEIQRLRKEVAVLRIEQVLREAGHYG
jgi:hypothetical protein